MDIYSVYYGSLLFIICGVMFMNVKNSIELKGAITPLFPYVPLRSNIVLNQYTNFTFLLSKDDMTQTTKVINFIPDLNLESGEYYIIIELDSYIGIDQVIESVIIIKNNQEIIYSGKYIKEYAVSKRINVSNGFFMYKKGSTLSLEVTYTANSISEDTMIRVQFVPNNKCPIYFINIDGKCNFKLKSNISTDYSIGDINCKKALPWSSLKKIATPTNQEDLSQLFSNLYTYSRNVDGLSLEKTIINNDETGCNLIHKKYKTKESFCIKETKADCVGDYLCEAELVPRVIKQTTSGFFGLSTKECPTTYLKKDDSCYFLSTISTLSTEDERLPSRFKEDCEQYSKSDLGVMISSMSLIYDDYLTLLLSYEKSKFWKTYYRNKNCIYYAKRGDSYYCINKACIEYGKQRPHFAVSIYKNNGCVAYFEKRGLFLCVNDPKCKYTTVSLCEVKKMEDRMVICSNNTNPEIRVYGIPSLIKLEKANGDQTACNVNVKDDKLVLNTVYYAIFHLRKNENSLNKEKMIRSSLKLKSGTNLIFETEFNLNDFEKKLFAVSGFFTVKDTQKIYIEVNYLGGATKEDTLIAVQFVSPGVCPNSFYQNGNSCLFTSSYGNTLSHQKKPIEMSNDQLESYCTNMGNLPSLFNSSLKKVIMSEKSSGFVKNVIMFFNKKLNFAFSLNEGDKSLSMKMVENGQDVLKAVQIIGIEETSDNNSYALCEMTLPNPPSPDITKQDDSVILELINIDNDSKSNSVIILITISVIGVGLIFTIIYYFMNK